MAVIFSEVDFPWWLLAATIGWNLFWLNFRFILNFIFSKFKGAYIDRQKQTISFTWHVSGNPEKNEFGHATFPLSDIEAFASMQLRNQYGGSAYALCLAHKDHDTFEGAFLQISVSASARNTNFCQLEWELIQRFADNTLPLPDMPDLEAFRHLDPVTVKYDKKHKRLKTYWRNMHVKQQRAIEAEVEEQVSDFFFSSALDNPERYAQKELEKPWRTWKIDREYFAKEEAIPLWKRRRRTILRQLIIGV
ncbi:MAG: hypothetical protein MJK12_16000 [Colwellia sp.]|nr:hypothetical protein [Colwellia sp.]